MWKSLAVVLATGLFVRPLLAQPAATAPPAPVIGQFVRNLAPGTRVKLKLTGGGKVNGLLIATEDDAVTVKPRTRIPEPARRIMLSEIADADVAGGSVVGKSVAIGAAVGAAAALSFMFLLVLLYGSD
jgi:hypothetical protein